MSNHDKTGQLGLNIPRPFSLMLCAAALILWAFRCAGTGKELAAVLQSIKTYETRILHTHAVSPAAVETLEARLAALRALPDRGDPLDTGDRKGRIVHTLALLRKLLTEASIQPERFRITGTGPNESAECILRCPPDRFFAFLGELSRHEDLRLTYLTIKNGPETGPLIITMRVTYDDL